MGRRAFTSGTILQSNRKLLEETERDGVVILRMNNPKRLNAWDAKMLDEVEEAFGKHARDPNTKGLVLTGTDPYYCAGVQLSELIKPQVPSRLQTVIEKKNENLFDMFLSFPKPLVCAVNGPAIGASVTSATLADAIIASENATFHTPFATLGITPEGCSSVHFERILGKENADRMLGKEAWKPTAKEAAEVGLITKAVAHEALLDEAERTVRDLVAGGKPRPISEYVEEYKQVNHAESIALARAFFGVPFLENQKKFLQSRGKDKQARFFSMVLLLRPLWSLFLK